MAIRSDNADWSFARRPFWLFSHVFALGVVISFVFLGLWQGDRHRERAELNEIVEDRSNPPAATIESIVDSGDPAELDYRYVTATGTFLDADLVRVANRSQGGVAGDHVVALFQLTDGRLAFINRGFVPLGTPTSELAPAPSGTTDITGWLRVSAEQGWIGATDLGTGTVVPRLDVDAIAQRLDTSTGEVIPVSIQLEGDAQATDGTGQAGTSSFPDPVPLPPPDGGPHLSYMVQWFIFATLGLLFYGALLRRTASGRQRRAPVPQDPVSV